MNKEEILDIANNPSKHIQLAKIDGKETICYSSQFVKLLESIVAGEVVVLTKS